MMKVCLCKDPIRCQFDLMKMRTLIGKFRQPIHQETSFKPNFSLKYQFTDSLCFDWGYNINISLAGNNAVAVSILAYVAKMEPTNIHITATASFNSMVS